MIQVNAVVSEATRHHIDLEKWEGFDGWGIRVLDDLSLDLALKHDLFLRTKMLVPDGIYAVIQQIDPYVVPWSFLVTNGQGEHTCREFAVEAGEMLSMLTVKSLVMPAKRYGIKFKQGQMLAVVRFCVHGDEIRLIKQGGGE